MTGRVERTGDRTGDGVEEVAEEAEGLDDLGSGLGPAPTAAQREWAVAVGRRLLVLRERAGLTPEDAVDRMGVLAAAGDPVPGPEEAPQTSAAGGLDARRWRAVERGAAGALDSITVDEVHLIAGTLGVTAAQLMDPASPLPDPAAGGRGRAGRPAAPSARTSAPDGQG